MSDSRIAPSTAAASTSAVAASTQDKGATKILDDTIGEEVVSDHRVVEDLTNLVTISGADNIKTFLERPTIIQNGILQTTDNGKIWSLDPIIALLASVKADKLKNIFMFKADLEIVLNVNAVRFQTGRYILAFVPSMGIPIGSTGFQTFMRMHTATKSQVTQLHHVEIDIATQTHVTLQIPWMSVLAAFPNQTNLTNPVGFGMLFLYPYRALRAGSGDSTAGFTCWASFKNIILSAPTVTQAPSLGEMEQKAAGIGPVAAALGKVAKVATILGEIPLLTMAATQVGWTASIMARAANVFGWSKPIELQKVQYVAPRLLHYIANSDQISTAVPMGLLSDNRVSSAPTACIPKHDEMALDFIKQIFAWYDSFDWSASDAYGALLQSYEVGPYKYENIGKGYVDLPCSFPLEFFQKWRGGMRFRFKLVKNEFYSGRISVAFQPYGTGGTNNAVEANQELLNRVVVDIRETSQFDIEVPYVSHLLYQGGHEFIGRLMITVIDPLVAPSSVPSAVSFIVEICAAADMEYAWMMSPPIELYAPAVVQADYEIFPLTRLGESVSSSSIRPAVAAMGEKAESLRQVAKVFTPLMWNGSPGVPGNATWDFQPFWINYVHQVTTNATTLTRGQFYGDNFSLITGCYAGTTGSVRVQAFQDVVEFGPMFVGLTGGAQTPSRMLSYGGNDFVNAKLFRTVFDPKSETYVDVNVPSFQVTAGRSVPALLFSDDAVTTYGPTAPGAVYTGVTIRRYVVNQTGADFFYQFARQASDDWNCYHWVSTPTVVAITVA